MKIKAVLIDDELDCLKQFKKEGGDQLDDLLLHQISSIDEASAYLKNPENQVNLVFCDIRLDPAKEREDTGFDLIAEVQEHYKQQLDKQGLPFGVVFITRHAYAYELITRMLRQTLPTTWCGFMRKWIMPIDGEERSFYLQIADILKTFKSKFSVRVSDFQADKFQINQDWFFNGYIDDYLNREMQSPKKVRYRDIVAFEKIIKESNVTNMYYRSSPDSSVLEVTEIDYDFKTLCRMLPADIDFSEKDFSLSPDERMKRPVVFAKVSGHWLVNLADSDWRRVTSRRNSNGQSVNASGHEVFLQHRGVKGVTDPLVALTHKECKWGKDYLKLIIRQQSK